MLARMAPACGEVEGSDGRVHLIETLAAAQKFGIDRADLVEHLAQFAEVGKELRDLGVGCIRHVTKPRAIAGSPNCGKISLGAVSRSIGAVTVGSAAALVGLDQRTTQHLLDRGRPRISWWRRLRRAADEKFCMFVGQNQMMSDRFRTESSVKPTVACQRSDEFGRAPTDRRHR